MTQYEDSGRLDEHLREEKTFMDRLLAAHTKPPRRKKRGRPEAKVQKAIFTLLSLYGCLVAVTDAGVLAKMGLGMACGIPKGWPDLTCCLPDGRFLGVECKAPGGRQSPEQKDFQQRIEQRHGHYILAHSTDEFLAAFNKIVPIVR